MLTSDLDNRQKVQIPTDEVCFFLEQPGPLDTHGLRARLPDAGETAVQHHLQRRI